MAFLDKTTFQLLLEQIEKMNINLRDTSLAIDKLSLKLNDIDHATFQNLSENIEGMNQNLQASSEEIKNLTTEIKNLKQSNTFPKAKLVVNTDTTQCHADDAPSTMTFRSLGYVNWDKKHDVIRAHKYIKVSYLRDLIDKMIITLSLTAQGNQNTNAITLYGYQTQTVYKHFAELKTVTYVRIDEETRFPTDAVYIDLENPTVKSELDFMDKLNVIPTQGALDRFVYIIEQSKTNCHRFEYTYGLTWV